MLSSYAVVNVPSGLPNGEGPTMNGDARAQPASRTEDTRSAPYTLNNQPSPLTIINGLAQRACCR